MPVLIMMNKPYNDGEALETVVHYVLRTGSEYCGGYGVDLNYPVQQMQQVKDLWGKDHGRRVRHFILSFKRSESIGYDQAMKLGFEICRYYADYQSVYGLHHDMPMPKPSPIFRASAIGLFPVPVITEGPSIFARMMTC